MGGGAGSKVIFGRKVHKTVFPILGDSPLSMSTTVVLPLFDGQPTQK